MKNVITVFLVVIAAMVLFFLGRVEKEIVDDVNITTAIGFDQVSEDKIKGTAVIPVFKGNDEIQNETFIGESTIAKEVFNSLQKISADPLVTGGIKIALYGEEVARKGINEYVDSLIRDASVGSKILLAVVDGKAEDILKGNLGNRGTGVYLQTLIQHNIDRRDLPQSNLHTFLTRYFEQGMDSYLPYVKLEGNKVEIKGLAIFKDEKMVDIVSPENMFFFKAMVANFSEGSHTVYLKDINEYAAIKRIVSKRQIKVDDVNGDPKVTVHIYLQGILSEFTGRRTNEKIIADIIAQLEKEIVERSEEMLKKFQKENADPVGIGFMAHTSQRDFNDEKWKNGYPDVKINVTSKVELIQTGVIE